MKKTVMLLMLALLCSASFAQMVDDNPSVVRSGNSYLVGDVFMNKKEFMGYLQSQDAVSYQLFHSAYRLSNTGWGLFAGGLLLEAIGAGINTGDAARVGVTIASVGSLSLISGIVCLGVGYSRMHNTPTLYNARLESKKSNISFNVVTSRDGVGIAMRF